tara:strand:- start:579 stop:752 length:174 start_codon:yes stop_codon:yes gene_type:complete
MQRTVPKYKQENLPYIERLQSFLDETPSRTENVPQYEKPHEVWKKMGKLDLAKLLKY